MEDSLIARTRLLLGDLAVQRMEKSHVLIIGLGGVGSMAAEVLVRSGVGSFTLVDYDKYTNSNLNRQIFATAATLNRSKTAVAAERLKSISKTVQVYQKPIKIAADTINDLLNGSYDFVIDAIDSLSAKTDLLEQLVKREIPFVSAMGAALKTDLTQIKVSSMKKTSVCPLAAFVRKRLRRRGVDLSFPVVWSSEYVSNKNRLSAVDETDSLNRRAMGSLMTVTGMFGLMCASEALFYLTHNEKSFYHGRFRN